jgi:hypothetical protein
LNCPKAMLGWGGVPLHCIRIFKLMDSNKMSVGCCLLRTFEVKTMCIGLVKQTPWPLVRKRTIPTERPPLVGEI